MQARTGPNSCGYPPNTAPNYRASTAPAKASAGVVSKDRNSSKNEKSRNPYFSKMLTAKNTLLKPRFNKAALIYGLIKIVMEIYPALLALRFFPCCDTLKLAHLGDSKFMSWPRAIGAQRAGNRRSAKPPIGGVGLSVTQTPVVTQEFVKPT